MKVLQYLIFSLFLCLMTVTAVSAQQTAATSTKKIYKNITVEKFTIREGVEFPADKIDSLTKSVGDTLTKSNRFNQVTLTGDATNPATEPTLKISAEVIKYVKGNRAARYVIGLGVGATKIITDVKFTDVQTGEVIHQQTVDGDVTWGFFGGDSEGAKSGVADEIIRVMKKNGIAGDKIKKTK